MTFQYYYAMTILRKFAAYRKDEEYITFLDRKQAQLGELIQKLCWDEDRFIRGYTERGEIIGRREDKEANMWLNPQSWAVISGLATDGQADRALDTVYERLNTEYGVVLMDPPYYYDAFDGALAVIYNAGVKENSGIFSQSQGWIILAEALRGHGERAFTYFKENAPAAQNDRAEIRRLEPYCYGQFTEGKVINIYSFNEELRTRITAVYPEIAETSADGTISTLIDDTTINWIINPSQDGVYQKKLDEALLAQGSAAADNKVDIFAAEIDYVVKYTDADMNVAMPLADLGIDLLVDLEDQFEFTMKRFVKCFFELLTENYSARRQSHRKTYR